MSQVGSKNNTLPYKNISSKIDVQSQKAVSAYFTSKQILPFGFTEKCPSPLK